MKLKLNLTLLIALMIVSPSLLKGQVVKKLGNDSVIVLTLKQGRAINNLIDSLEKVSVFKSDSILTFKKYISKYTDSIAAINKELISQKIDHYATKEAIMNQNRMNLDSLNDYKNRYYKNIEIYNKFEKYTNTELFLHRLNSVLFAFLTIFAFSNIR